MRQTRKGEGVSEAETVFERGEDLLGAARAEVHLRGVDRAAPVEFGMG